MQKYIVQYVLHIKLPVTLPADNNKSCKKMSENELESAENRPLLNKEISGTGLSNSILDTDSGISRSVAHGLYLNFVTMSVAFSCNHGCVVSCLAYATAELGNKLGGYYFRKFIFRASIFNCF